MANFVYQNQKILLAHYDLTGRVNSLTLSQSQDALDDTVLGANTKSNFPGLRSVAFSFAGLYDPDASYDGALSSQLGLTNKPVAFADSTTVGSLAYFCNALLAEYTPFQNSVGELVGFSAGGVVSQGTSAPANLIRGQVAYWTENLTTNANGTAISLGAVSSSQRVYCAVMSLSLPSTTYSLLPTLQSATSSGFGSLTTQLTFSSFTSPGSSFMSRAGSITDTWWRLAHVTATSSASTGVSLASFIGIF